MSELISVPFVDLKPQYQKLASDLNRAMARVVESQYFILGPEVEQLEKAIASYTGCKQGMGVSSGTDALLIVLMALGIGPGDEVVTTPYTFFGTAGAIARVGARPVFVDIAPESFNIDPKKIEAAISSRTRALMPVHLFGQMADMHAICEIAEKHKLAVIEDAAQAIGARFDNKPACSYGRVGCLSFFPTKNLGGFGDGGMVTTQDDGLASVIRQLRNHGMEPKYYHSKIGGNFRLDALQAAILSV